LFTFSLKVSFTILEDVAVPGTDTVGFASSVAVIATYCCLLSVALEVASDASLFAPTKAPAICAASSPVHEEHPLYNE
jgi:hypothetical protein